jgi:uncharacterized membrane protein YfcA
MTFIVLFLGLWVGVLVGLLGIGGGVVLVPAMAYFLGMDQHLAQGTSLFVLLPPIGLGALREYWKQGQVDLQAGILCVLGILFGAYGGSLVALPMPSRHLQGLFGGFLMLSAILLWRKAHLESGSMTDGMGRHLGILAVAGICGIASGMFGIGGGVLLVPLLCLLFSFSQHRAQGTSLVALIPPTGVLALIAYARQGFVSWRTGLLLIPGVFLGGIAGGILAKKLKPRRMRQVFAGILFALGTWQALSAWWR